MADERSRWKEVTELLDAKRVVLGPSVSGGFAETPHRALAFMSYYKFAAKMIGKGKRVLDIGCKEGLGTWLLACECGSASGVDSDEAAIHVAKSNWDDSRIRFHCGDFLLETPEQCQAVVAFDVSPDMLAAFMTRISANLGRDGVAVIGTPNVGGRAQHLEKEMLRWFSHVFVFAADDEVVRAGFSATAPYLIAVGCGKKTAPRP